jgi:predicted ribosomally synthesized peptide with SipW-like signal peptide
MSNNEGFGISRREVLAGLGTIGVASAGAGLGTTAYFSDREDFEGNKLVAGELDLKVDWTEHYSDWSSDENDDRTDELPDADDGETDTESDNDPWDDASELGDTDGDPAPDFPVVMLEPNEAIPAGSVVFPSTASDSARNRLAVPAEYADDFLANTTIESFPDIDPSVASNTIDPADYDAQKFRFGNDSHICDTDADLDGALSSPYRTRGTFGEGPNPQTTEPGDQLVNIEDVKPGDFGEVTFSFHLCGNPGYIWLTGGLADADENRPNPEPEESDPDEYGVGDSNDPDPGELFPNEGDEDASGTTAQERVELLDEIRASIWYDTGPDGIYGPDFADKDLGEGDNYRQMGENFIAGSGSLRNVLQALEGNLMRLSPNPGPGGTTDNSGSSGGGNGTLTEGTLNNILTGNPLTNADFEEFQANSNVECDALARELKEEGYLSEAPNWVDTKIDDVETNGLPDGKVTGGMCEFTIDDSDPTNGWVEITAPGPVQAVIVKGGGGNLALGSNFYVWPEPVFLNNVRFQTPLGQAISNLKVCCPSDGNGGNGGNGNGECFPNSTTAYIGFEWWLPVNHANEIQGDSVSFDLGFYTEQCRHNDGQNPDPENYS